MRRYFAELIPTKIQYFQSVKERLQIIYEYLFWRCVCVCAYGMRVWCMSEGYVRGGDILLPLYIIEKMCTHFKKIYTKSWNINQMTKTGCFTKKISHGQFCWAYGVVVSIFDFHRSARGSNPGRGGKISCSRLHYSAAPMASVWKP